MSNIEMIIKSFAKANKIGAVKAETFAKEIISTWQQENPAQPQIIRAGGRPVSEGTIALRGIVEKAVVSQGLRTTEQIATVCPEGTPKVYICHALNWLEEAGKVKRIGKDTSKIGKGKKPNIWGSPAEMQDTKEGE